MDPFTADNLKRIFQVDDERTNRLTSRENSTLEFKESFNWGSREVYTKTMAAFANAKGGYIVFGVSDNPRRLVGLKSNKFQELDPAKITEFLNTTISPELRWEASLYETNGVEVGLLYTFEALKKPVICMRNTNEFKEADILYRYRGRSEKIKYAELKTVVDEEREKEAKLWMNHIQQIATVGVHQVGIFNANSGKVTGAGGSFLIDQALLPQLKFIKEGQFSETTGDPTLRLIGEASAVYSPIQPVKEMIKYKNIRATDILETFLKKEKPEDPLEYFRSICFEASGYLPIYYYLNLAGISVDEGMKIVKEIQTSSASTAILIKRLSATEDFRPTSNLSSGTAASAAKTKYLQAIKTKSIPEHISMKDLKYLLESVRFLRKGDFQWDYLAPYLLNIFKRYYATGAIADPFRRAVCHLDQVHFQAHARKNSTDNKKTDGVVPAPVAKVAATATMTITPVGFLTAAELTPGLTVEHPKFGRGSVVRIIGHQGREVAIVLFGEGVGQKILDPNFAKLMLAT